MDQKRSRFLNFNLVTWLVMLSALLLGGCTLEAGILVPEEDATAGSEPVEVTSEEVFQQFIGFEDINSSILLTIPEELRHEPAVVGDTIRLLIENTTGFTFRYSFHEAVCVNSLRHISPEMGV